MGRPSLTHHLLKFRCHIRIERDGSAHMGIVTSIFAVMMIHPEQHDAPGATGAKRRPTGAPRLAA